MQRTKLKRLVVDGTQKSGNGLSRKEKTYWTKPLRGSVNLPTPSKISLAFLPASLSTIDVRRRGRYRAEPPVTSRGWYQRGDPHEHPTHPNDPGYACPRPRGSDPKVVSPRGDGPRPVCPSSSRPALGSRCPTLCGPSHRGPAPRLGHL